MLAMSTLMMPAATVTTMTNPGPIPVAQAKFTTGGGGGVAGAVGERTGGESNGKLAPLNHNATGNKSGTSRACKNRCVLEEGIGVGTALAYYNTRFLTVVYLMTLDNLDDMETSDVIIRKIMN
jgi:hypothetical protein